MLQTINRIMTRLRVGQDSLGTNGPTLSLICLVIANLIPLLGVVFAKWDAFAIVLLFWMENFVIGFYNILKMIFVKIPEAPKGRSNEPGPWIRYFLIPFFTLHYGGFTAGHLVFILSIFHRPVESVISWQLLLPVFGLFVSHGVSFVVNFLIQGERERIDIGTLMFQPYLRIGIIHIAIIVGGYGAYKSGSPLWILLILICLKTVLDIFLHRRERRRGQKKP